MTMIPRNLLWDPTWSSSDIIISAASSLISRHLGCSTSFTNSLYFHLPTHQRSRTNRLPFQWSYCLALPRVLHLRPPFAPTSSPNRVRRSFKPTPFHCLLLRAYDHNWHSADTSNADPGPAQTLYFLIDLGLSRLYPLLGPPSHSPFYLALLPLNADQQRPHHERHQRRAVCDSS